MPHTKAGRVFDTKLAVIIHDQIANKVVPSSYRVKYGFRYRLVDHQVSEIAKLLGEPEIKTTVVHANGDVSRGCAMWRNVHIVGSKFEAESKALAMLKSVMVKDEIKLHNDHVDFVVTETDISWDDTKTLKRSRKISRSISIDEKEHSCKVTCGSLSANLGCHVMAWRVAKGEIPVWEARKLCMSLAKQTQMELENAYSINDAFTKSVHATILAYLTDMYIGYTMNTERAVALIENEMIGSTAPPTGSQSSYAHYTLMETPSRSPSIMSKISASAKEVVAADISTMALPRVSKNKLSNRGPITVKEEEDDDDSITPTTYRRTAQFM